MIKILRNALLAGLTVIYFPVYADTEGIDLMSDDFSVLKHVGNQYMAENYQDQDVSKVREFGLGFKSHGDLKYPKSGFIGYELHSASGDVSVFKLQLYKDENGWRFERMLENSKIDQANPHHVYESGHARSDQSGKAVVAAAVVLEDWLNNEGLIGDVRSTSMTCYLNKSLSRGSCRGVYGLMTGAEVECKAKNYLLQNTAESWSLVKEIRDDQKVNYSTGELEPHKPFSMYCS